MRCVAGLRETRFPFRVVLCRARREDGATVTPNCGGRRVGKTTPMRALVQALVQSGERHVQLPSAKRFVGENVDVAVTA